MATILDWNQIYRKSLKFLRETHFVKLQQALIEIVQDEKSSLGPQLSTAMKKYKEGWEKFFISKKKKQKNKKTKKHVLQISLEMAKDNDGKVRMSLGQIQGDC